MGTKLLEKKDQCFFAFMNHQPRGTLKALSSDAREAFIELVRDAIAEVMEDHPAAFVRTIVRKVKSLIQDECDEIRIRDEDEQAIAKIIEAAMDKFLANSDLGGADEKTGDRIVGLVWEHMEEVAKDWYLNAHTSLAAVIDDLIAEAVSRSEEEIEELLSEMPTNDDGDQGFSLSLRVSWSFSVAVAKFFFISRTSCR